MRTEKNRVWNANGEIDLEEASAGLSARSFPTRMS